MILKISSEKYYGYQGRTKELFRKKYRSLKLKWMVGVNLNGVLSDGWFNDDKSQYLLKLSEEGDFKRFTGNSIKMIEFLKLYGAVEYEGDEKGIHIDYDDNKGFLTQKDRFGCFVGADLLSHYRTEELLKDMPSNWGVNWGKGSIIINDVNLIEKKRIVRIIRR